MKVDMFTTQKLWKTIAVLASLVVIQPSFAADTLVDSASFEFGGGSKVQMVRAGLQSDWSSRWFQSKGSHLSGYWELNLGQWRANAYQNRNGQRQNITTVGMTPVFRFQRDDKKGFYAEGGIGLNLLSALYDNDSNRLSTHFQFGDHIGVGYVFDNKWELGMKFQHYSNGGYKKPNSGVNWLVVKAAYHF